MKNLSFLVVMLFSITTISQEKIQGQILIAKEGISLGGKVQEKGNQLEFKYNGKQLDISIGTTLYEDVEFTAGMAIKLDGEACFSLTLSDGISANLFDIKSTEGTKSEAILKADANARMNIGPEVCLNWLDNKVFATSPARGNFQRLVSIPKTTLSLIDYLWQRKVNLDFEIGSEFTIASTYDEGIESTNIELDTYCLDWSKKIPDPSTSYNGPVKFDLQNEKEITQVQEIFHKNENTNQLELLQLEFLERNPEVILLLLYTANNEELESIALKKVRDRVLQEQIWKIQFTNNPNESYYSEVKLTNSLQEGITYGEIVLFNNYEILIYPKETLENTEYNSTILIDTYENKQGELISSDFSNDVLRDLEDQGILNLSYIKSRLK